MIDVRYETAGSNLIPRRITNNITNKNKDEKYVGKCNVGHPGPIHNLVSFSQGALLLEYGILLLGWLIYFRNLSFPVFFFALSLVAYNQLSVDQSPVRHGTLPLSSRRRCLGATAN